MRRTPLILAALAFVGLLVPLAAHAHVGTTASVPDVTPRLDLATTILRAAPPAAPPITLLLGLAGGVLLGLAARSHPRRVLVLALAALLAVFAVEAGIHSVHHLGERAATACALAAAASHLTLGVDDAPPVISACLTPAGAVIDEHFASPVAPGLGPDLARAPPAPIA